MKKERRKKKNKKTVEKKAVAYKKVRILCCVSCSSCKDINSSWRHKENFKLELN